MKKLLANLRLGMALFLAMFSTNLLPVAVANAQTIPGDMCPLINGKQDTLEECTAATVPQTCDDLIVGQTGWEAKVEGDFGDIVPYTAPSGFLVDKYCVKAGSVNQPDGGPVIVPVTPPSSQVNIDYPLKDSISHYIVHLIAAPSTATPVAPSVTDQCGTNLDAVTLGTTTGITYTKSQVGLVVTVTAAPASAGYVLQAGNGFTLNQNGTATLIVTLTDVPCVLGQTAVTPELPTYSDVCGTTNDLVVSPEDDANFAYTLSGNVLTATLKSPSTHDFGTNLNGYVVAQDGLTATFTVTHQFTNAPCVDVCPTVLQTNLSTNVNKNGWTVPEVAEYVDGGLKLNVSGDWDQSYISRSFTGTLADIGSVVDIQAAPNQYVGIHVQTSMGLLTYEEEPSYDGKWWSTSDFGVASGMGYDTFDTLENIVRENPDLAVSVVYVLYTHPDASSTTVASVTFGCTKYTFDKEEDVEEKMTELCHATGSETNPYRLISIAVSGAYNGHLGDGNGDHQNGEDIIPPFVYQGQTYSQNWPSGQAIYENDCVAVDVCPTVEGIQTSRDDCGQVQGSNDVCPNIEGTQTTVPAGMTKNSAGKCVTAGGMGAGGVLGTSTTAQVLGTALPTELPATGGTSMPNPMLSLVAGVLTYLFLARRNKKLEV